MSNKCEAEHTKYQPTDEEWLCPKCGADFEHFVIEDSAVDSNEDCLLLHKEDSIYCRKCDLSISGKNLAAKLLKKHNLVPCPCCRGRGFVPGKTE